MHAIALTIRLHHCFGISLLQWPLPVGLGDGSSTISEMGGGSFQIPLIPFAADLAYWVLLYNLLQPRTNPQQIESMEFEPKLWIHFLLVTRSSCNKFVQTWRYQHLWSFGHRPTHFIWTKLNWTTNPVQLSSFQFRWNGIGWDEMKWMIRTLLKALFISQI